jgi:hypothetical protein
LTAREVFLYPRDMKRLCAPFFLFVSLASAFGQTATPDYAKDAAGIGVWVLPYVFALIPLIINLALMVWVGKDAKHRDMDNRGIWMVFVFLTGFFGWFVYLLVRPTTTLSPANGCVIDTKWKVGPLSYHACAVGPSHTQPEATNIPLPEVIIFDHVGFKGASARTNLSFHYLGKFWDDRISSVIVVNGVWRFYRDAHYGGDYWDLGPGYYECFFTSKGPDDVVSSFQAIALS